MHACIYSFTEKHCSEESLVVINLTVGILLLLQR